MKLNYLKRENYLIMIRLPSNKKKLCAWLAAATGSCSTMWWQTWLGVDQVVGSGFTCQARSDAPSEIQESIDRHMCMVTAVLKLVHSVNTSI